MESVRNSVKAIIIQDGHVLFNKMHYHAINDTFYILPGGGQNHGETFHQTLVRECREEIGAEVQPQELLLVREYIGKNHKHACIHSHVHQVEYMFRARLLTPPGSAVPTQRDEEQVDTVWLPLARLKEYNIYPQALAGCFSAQGGFLSPAVYIGDAD